MWNSIIEANTHIMFGSMLSHPDGGFVIAGSTYDRSIANIFLIKTDAKGQVQQ